LTSPDDDFMGVISDEGNSYGPAWAAVSNAQYVCGAIDDGADPVDLGGDIVSNTDLSTHQAAVFVVESVFNYCPDHMSLLP
jgi:Protein of unknown function (DUF732)